MLTIYNSNKSVKQKKASDYFQEMDAKCVLNKTKQSKAELKKVLEEQLADIKTIKW